ncbi:17562_t:CDS:10 [Rhizophagus irregularis]|nr:17562_t:CDS:10 [Rhizophagus irregularis]
MSTEEYSKPINQENIEVISPTLKFESLSRSIFANDSRQKPELFFKHQNRNPFLKEKRIVHDQAAEFSDASDINTNIKTPNVFASPLFRTRTRLSFKEFQKKEINNPLSSPAAQNNIAGLSFEKNGKELKDTTNEPFKLNPPNFKKKTISDKEILNQGNSSDNKKAVEHPNQELSIHDKSNDTFDQTPPIQEKLRKTSDDVDYVDYSLLDNPSPQSLELSGQPLSEDKHLVHDTKSGTCTDQTTLDYNEIKDSTDILKENDKDITEKSNLFKKPLPENNQNNTNSYCSGNPSSNTSSPRTPRTQIQISYSKVDDQQPKLKFHDKVDSSNQFQVMANLNKDNNIFPNTEHSNSDTNGHLRSDDDLNLIVKAVQRWRDEVIRRDYLIGELRGQTFTLRDTLEHKEHSLSHYRERMFFVESMVKRQNSYTERSRERINNVKLKYSLFRNLLCNMGKNIEEIYSQKERIEKEIESMRLEFSKLTTKHKSTLDNYAVISQTQQAQTAQISELNAHLNNAITQSRQGTQEIDNKVSRSSSVLDAIRLKLEHLLNELESEKSAYAEEFQKLKLKFERAEEDNRNLVKITSLTANNDREIESAKLECTRLNSIIKEKDERINQLGIVEKEKDEFKVEISQAKDYAEKEVHSLKQEMEMTRARHEIDIKCVEAKFREDHYILQNDFHKERCQFEAKLREERIRLESEYREERTHRSRLEDECRDEISKRFRIEIELRSSEQKIEELSKTNDKNNIRIAQLESQLNEIDRRQTDISTVAVGTADILELDLQIEHKKIVSELSQESFDDKKRIEELISELETWKSRASSFESQLTSLKLKYDELQNEHSRSLVEISNNYLQNKEAVNKALKLAANDYQETVKRINIEHESEIRKRDCKIREAETKEAFLTEENQALKSKLSEMENHNKSLQCQLDSLENNVNSENVASASEKNKVNLESSDSVISKLSPPGECGNSRITQENSEILKNEQHYQFARRLLTLTEIDAMILESTSGRFTNVDTKVNDVRKTEELNNTLMLQETEHVSQNVIIQSGQTNNDLFDSCQNSNNMRDIDDWLSPGTKLRSKRRKRDYPESGNKPEPIERFPVQAKNVSMNVDVKEESKLEASFRFRSKSKVGRRFTTGRANGRE